MAGVVWVEAARCRCTGSQQPAGRVPWPGPVLSCRWAGRWSCCCSCSWSTPWVRGAGAHRGVRKRASGGSGRHRRGTAGGVTRRAVGAAPAGHRGRGRDRAGAPTYASTMPVPAWPVLTRRDHRWGRPSPGSGAAVRGPHAVAPWTPKVAGVARPRLPAIASGSQQSSADHRAGPAPWRPTVTNLTLCGMRGEAPGWWLRRPGPARLAGSEGTLRRTPGVSDRDQPDQDRARSANQHAARRNFRHRRSLFMTATPSINRNCTTS